MRERLTSEIETALFDALSESLGEVYYELSAKKLQSGLTEILTGDDLQSLIYVLVDIAAHPSTPLSGANFVKNRLRSYIYISLSHAVNAALPDLRAQYGGRRVGRKRLAEDLSAAAMRTASIAALVDHLMSVWREKARHVPPGTLVHQSQLIRTPREQKDISLARDRAASKIAVAYGCTVAELRGDCHRAIVVNGREALMHALVIDQKMSPAEVGYYLGRRPSFHITKGVQSHLARQARKASAA